jgi:hypothetical protein
MACVLTGVTGCGGDYSAPPDQADQKQQQGCRSPELSVDKVPGGGATKLGKTFSVDFSDLTETAGKVSLTPRAAKVVGEVGDRFTDRGTYRAAAGYRFVAVAFTFSNDGTEEIEAANSVGNQFVLATSDGRAWQRVDRTEGCTTVSSSLSAPAKVTDPETDIKPGEKYNTLIVYSVPESSGSLVWAGAGHRVAIEPKAPQ